MDAKKYHNKFMALEEAAKNEIIGLLKNNPKGRFIQPNDHYGEDDFHFTEGVWALTGDEDAIIVTAVRRLATAARRSLLTIRVAAAAEAAVSPSMAANLISRLLLMTQLLGY